MDDRKCDKHAEHIPHVWKTSNKLGFSVKWWCKGVR